MRLEIKTYRKRAGLTQKRLAEMLCVTQKTLYSWETGEVSPNIDCFCKLATILECTPNDLCCWYEEHPEQKTKAVKVVQGYKEADTKTRRIVDDLLDLKADED